MADPARDGCLDDFREIGIVVGGRQESGEALRDMNAPFPHQVIEERRGMILGGEFEEEDRTEMMNSGRHAMALEGGVKVVHETCDRLGQSFLQAWPGCF
jgi:hypothetical protein